MQFIDPQVFCQELSKLKPLLKNELRRFTGLVAACRFGYIFQRLHGIDLELVLSMRHISFSASFGAFSSLRTAMGMR